LLALLLDDHDRDSFFDHSQGRVVKQKNEAVKGKYSGNEKKGEGLRSYMGITGYQQISRLKPDRSVISISALILRFLHDLTVSSHLL
jgi:hypothetical protein